MPIRPPDRLIARLLVAGVLLGSLASCARRGACTGDYCGTVVIAAAGEPDILLPPVTELSTSRDVYDQLFLKLADLGMSGNTIGDEDFQPQLAERWEWNGPVTLVFHLDPRARWQDGRVVTAGDVVFTYDAYTDSLVNSPFRSSLRLISAVTARDSLTAVFRFRQRYPEMFYDAVYQMRILPAHLLRTIPRDQWRSAPFGRAPVGDGPYRFVAWKAGESLELAADSTFYLGRPHIRRVIVRFTPNLGGDHAARRRRGGCDRTARLARQREARVRGPPARVLSPQGGRGPPSPLQPRNARRPDQTPPPVRRPRAAPRRRPRPGPPAPAAPRV